MSELLIKILEELHQDIKPNNNKHVAIICLNCRVKTF